MLDVEKQKGVSFLLFCTEIRYKMDGLVDVAT